MIYTYTSKNDKHATIGEYSIVTFKQEALWPETNITYYVTTYMVTTAEHAKRLVDSDFTPDGSSLLESLPDGMTIVEHPILGVPAITSVGGEVDWSKMNPRESELLKDFNAGIIRPGLTLWQESYRIR